MKCSQAVHTDFGERRPDNRRAPVNLRLRKPRQGRGDAGVRAYGRGRGAARPRAAAAGGRRPHRRVLCAHPPCSLPPLASALLQRRCLDGVPLPPLPRTGGWAPLPSSGRRKRARRAAAAGRGDATASRERPGSTAQPTAAGPRGASQQGSLADISTTSSHGRGSAAAFSTRSRAARQSTRVTARDGRRRRGGRRARSDFLPFLVTLTPKSQKKSPAARAFRSAGRARGARSTCEVPCQCRERFFHVFPMGGRDRVGVTRVEKKILARIDGSRRALSPMVLSVLIFA